MIYKSECKKRKEKKEKKESIGGFVVDRWVGIISTQLIIIVIYM